MPTGPGEAGYVAQLKSYDKAFGQFFARLAADGITRDNTLFVVAPDENDHFVGGAPSPANCDGVTVPCTYAQRGEITTSIDRLLVTQRGNSTPFDIHFDDAPTFYIVGNPAPTAPVTRTMEHDLDALTATNPITGETILEPAGAAGGFFRLIAARGDRGRASSARKQFKIFGARRVCVVSTGLGVGGPFPFHCGRLLEGADVRARTHCPLCATLRSHAPQK